MNIADAIFQVVDTETTGLDPTQDALVEVAIVSTNRYRVTGMWASLIDPLREIPPEVSAVHMLTHDDLKHCRRWKDDIETDFWHYLNALDPEEPWPIVAHYADFDRGFIEPESQSWLCTKRLAQHIWPDSPTFKNQGLRYWRKTVVDTFGILPHRALADALVTAALLRDLLTCDEFTAMNITTVEQLLELSNSPIRVRRWDFGKFAGQPIEASDSGWNTWCLNKFGPTGEKPDLIYTLRLGRKEGWLK